MKKVSWTAEQLWQLRQGASHSPKPYLRQKCLALLNLAQGRGITDTARALCCSRTAIDQWIKRFEQEGLQGLQVRPGRGRKTACDPEVLKDYLRQRPLQFQGHRQRWTLTHLRQVVPGLQRYSLSGIWRLMQRIGYRYKRGQPRVSSPDPQYFEKKSPGRGAPTGAGRPAAHGPVI